MILSENPKVEKINWKAQIARLEQWVNERGYVIDFSDGYKEEQGMFVWEHRTIYVHKHISDKEKQFYILLHECGHFLIMCNAKQWKEKFPTSYGQSTNAYPQSNVVKMAFFEEEVEAWHRAVRLAKKLKLTVNRDKFERLKAKCLRKHIDYLFLK